MVKCLGADVLRLGFVLVLEEIVRPMRTASVNSKSQTVQRVAKVLDRTHMEFRWHLLKNGGHQMMKCCTYL